MEGASRHLGRASEGRLMGRAGANTRAPRDGEEVMVSCWCEKDFVWLAVEDIRAGRTERCHRPRCAPRAD